MNKIIVTKRNNQILTALMEDGKCRSLRFEPKEKSLLGTICIGKVQNVVKNIGAAFIDLGNGQMAFYSLLENQHPVFADAADLTKSAVPSGRKVKVGDELILQISKEAIKTKDPVVSCYLNITGKYCVVTLGKTQLGFSAKIKNLAWKEEIKKMISSMKEDWFGIIIRTNAKDALPEEILAEVQALKIKLQTLLQTANCRTCYSVLWRPESSYVLSLRDTYAKNLEEIVTDETECFTEMERYLSGQQIADLKKLTFYEDKLLPLSKLYSLDKVVEDALNRKVWLKSGGYLVIEPTEALTVIDVNTGKYSGKKNIEDTILKINLEAAKEAARQMELRNLSGIIIIDFIDMESKNHQKELLDYLETELLKDSVKTILVEMTKLGLVEITRKKAYKPLHEQVE